MITAKYLSPLLHAGLKDKNMPADFLYEQENAIENLKEQENAIEDVNEQETKIGRMLKNPELAGRDGRSRTFMRDPKFIRGIAQTIFVNFIDVCESVHRQPEHVMDYLFSEIGATGFLDEQQRLVIRRREIRFGGDDDILATLRNYVNRYVRCLCKNLDTILSKQDSIFF
ncbi:eukaryotic translation initiation factor 2 subunit beta-like [Papaver somniferum]|uniref:eukaryotic translation initiation factor 2 subunit beta-like n=1 Tax=Papaver somniferum TaxID=3469 RepID=UPI000E6FEC2C|nr:eukaryotic translation initiation factor 2 subunit beta-like [Papaver somniferum]